MLKKVLKFTGIALGGLIGLALLYYIKVYVSTEERINKVYEVVPEELTITYDSASVGLGKRLIAAKGCIDCHSQDLGGRIFIDKANTLGLITANNLTRGKGGLSKDFGNEDWVLALKHGLRKNGKPLFIMPSHEFTRFTAKDMAAIIAYCSTVPKIDRVLPESSVGPLGRILTDLGKVPLLPAEEINHTERLVEDMTPEVSVAYGKYLSVSCQGCHRINMKGGEPIAPGYPVVTDISSTGNPGKWTAEQFIHTLRIGKTPEGKILDPKKMPWPSAAAHTDVELKALHLYLKSL